MKFCLTDSSVHIMWSSCQWDLKKLKKLNKKLQMAIRISSIKTKGRETSCTDCTLVFLSLFFFSLQEYTVDLYVRQTWTDWRLRFNETKRTVTLNYNQLSRIWIPDLFFRNEKRAISHDVTVPNRLLRLYPDGTILYSQR